MITAALCLSLSASPQADKSGLQDIIRGKTGLILKDDLEINIIGKERDSDDADAESFRAFRIRRTCVVKILAPAGIRIFKRMVLPENFDPTEIWHGPQVKNLGTYYSEYRIDDFRINVKRQGKKPFAPRISRKVETVESFNLNFLYNYSIHAYGTDEVEAGDEVTVKYDITIPFRENYSRFASYRIFFNDSLPKLKCNLVITHHESVDIEFRENFLMPSKKSLSEGILTRTWSLENLPGCIGEAGSRPYLELPHLTWVMNFYKFYFNNTFSQKKIPHAAIISILRSPALPEIYTAVRIGSTSRNYAPFTRYMKELDTGSEQDYNIARNLHSMVNSEFSYQGDLTYYRRDDTRGERLGEFFENKVLRDQSRYNMYYAMLLTSRVNFYSAYVTDKRSGEFSERYFQTSFDNDHLIAIYLGERNFDFILPKSGRYGLNYNELPFYYEDCNARLVHLSEYSDTTSFSRQKNLSYQTHLSDPVNNIRRHDVRLSLDPDPGTMAVTGQITMSGQFSTMCRFAYLDGRTDPSVHGAYSQTLWKSASVGTPTLSEMRFISPQFPFNTEIGISFQASQRIKKEGDKYLVDLSGFFPYIFNAGRGNSNRYLDFFHDFAGTDEFNYEMQFPRTVELIEGVNVELENDFGKYYLKVFQEEGNTIRIKSCFTVKKTMVESGDYSEVELIFDLLKAANRLEIEFR